MCFDSSPDIYVGLHWRRMYRFCFKTIAIIKTCLWLNCTVKYLNASVRGTLLVASAKMA